MCAVEAFLVRFRLCDKNNVWVMSFPLYFISPQLKASRARFSGFGFCIGLLISRSLLRSTRVENVVVDLLNRRPYVVPAAEYGEFFT